MKIAKSSEKGWQCLGAEPFLFTLPGPFLPRDRKLILSKHPCTHLAPTPRHKRNEIKKKTSLSITTTPRTAPPSDGGPFERPPPISTDNPPTNAPCLILPRPCKLQTAPGFSIPNLDPMQNPAQHAPIPSALR